MFWNIVVRIDRYSERTPVSRQLETQSCAACTINCVEHKIYQICVEKEMKGKFYLKNIT